MKVRLEIFALLLVLTSLIIPVFAQQDSDLDHINELLKETKCKPYKSIYEYDSLISRETIFLTTLDSITLSRFSGRSIRISSSIGIIDLLKEYSQKEASLNKDSIGTSLSLLFLRQELDERLTLNFMDVATILAEIDCEQERLTEIRNYLQDRTNRKTRKLNILAITISSLETIGGGLIAFLAPEAKEFAFGLTMTGGLTSGYWGVKQLFIKHEVELYHPRNHIRELLEHPVESKIFPPNVWFFLTVPSGIDSDTISKRKELIQEFKESGLMDGYRRYMGNKIQTADILSANCGMYDVALLSHRINMLELLKIKINLMKYDLKRLQQELILKINSY